MTSNNTEWEQGWFYLRNDEPGLPLHRQGSEGEGRLLVPRLVPHSHQAWLDSLLTALKSLADAGLGAASVLANLHHRRIIPLMERELRIYEMGKMANPVSLARSRLVHDRFP
jgi:hypothetical protein